MHSPEITRTKLSGQTRYRVSLFGKIVLQVEEKQYKVRLLTTEKEQRRLVGKRWRDANTKDCAKLGILTNWPRDPLPRRG